MKPTKEEILDKHWNKGNSVKKAALLAMEEYHQESNKELILKVTLLKETAIKDQAGWNFPNEKYIETSGVIEACNEILEYLNKKP
jgi:hypothetical protein